ncbi:MAG TPA: TraR/DksA C4-type zinc finger protein [Acidimicrobiales bacterium]|nr:TraR/DksA C4-type zinc finger protein [Acidimicrobiales bacterium]
MSVEDARAAVEARIASLRASFDDVVAAADADPADDEHDPDGSGGVAYERQQVVALLRGAEDELVELVAAAARVADGTYGTCESCGGAIGEERLDAMPATRRCVRCA